MAYNAGQTAPGYGPPGFAPWGMSSSPPGAGGPPGMAGPPGSAPGPGSALPPGMAQPAHPLPARPGLPPGFLPPANMPNINFSAPVIRLGTSGPARDAPSGGRNRPDSNAEPLGNRRGLGMDRNMDQQRQQMRENMMVYQPPTREEIARTIFVGNISEGVGGDAGVERILRSAGGLRRWTRAADADNKPCKFGFAEFEDAQSLETAAEVLKNIEVPSKRPVGKPSKPKSDEGRGEEDEEAEVEKTMLLVVVDEASIKYAEEWRERRGESDDELQFRVDAAREALDEVLASLFKPLDYPDQDREGDVSMQEIAQMADPDTGEIIMIPINGDDELSDIPPEMRETVAAEITAFRERSTRRDLERLKREEELEARERASTRTTRQASPPTSAPSGPAVGSNNIPLGPRGVPNGPKARQQGGFHGAQIPKDYQNGVSFVNGNSAALSNYITREEEDSDASDEELERKRREKKEAEQEKMYLDYERRWLNRERSRAAAIEREKSRDEADAAALAGEIDVMSKRLKEWDDELETSRKTEEYYRDRSLWLRNRAAFRTREKDFDDRDRAEEHREQASIDQARGMADSFLDRQAEELSARAAQEPQRFKISLGAAAQKAQQAAAPKRRTVADVEGLLDNEEETGEATKRTLVPIKFDTKAEAAALTDEERREAQRRLASDIPTDKEGLWKWPVQWEFMEDAVVASDLKPFVEKKVMEYLGVQEQMLVDVVEESIKNRISPQDLVGELEGALDEEAEVLVKKLWRMIIFFSESEKRGLAG